MIIKDKSAKNVLGEPLEPCSLKPLTGFYRDGTCTALEDDIGIHAVCIYATKEFLEYSKSVGNDLSTPRPEFNFVGVEAGSSWCLGGYAFLKAIKDNMAPQIFIHATHERMLELIDLDSLKKYAIDL